MCILLRSFSGTIEHQRRLVQFSSASHRVSCERDEAHDDDGVIIDDAISISEAWGARGYVGHLSIKPTGSFTKQPNLRCQPATQVLKSVAGVMAIALQPAIFKAGMLDNKSH